MGLFPLFHASSFFVKLLYLFGLRFELLWLCLESRWYITLMILIFVDSMHPISSFKMMTWSFAFCWIKLLFLDLKYEMKEVNPTSVLLPKISCILLSFSCLKVFSLWTPWHSTTRLSLMGNEYVLTIFIVLQHRLMSTLLGHFLSLGFTRWPPRSQ